MMAVSAFLLLSPAFAQSECLTKDEANKLLTQFAESESLPLNKKLRDELLKLKGQSRKLFESIIRDSQKENALVNGFTEMREKNDTKLCQILKKHGWPTVAQVGRDGVLAAFFLLKNIGSFELQKQLLPIIAAAVKRNEIDRSDFAELVDRLRVRAGQKQIFGTQATIENGFLVLSPIEAEAQVDVRRKSYSLPPLAEYQSILERAYQIPLIKSPTVQTNLISNFSRDSVAPTPVDNLLKTEMFEEDAIQVETTLVNFNVSVFHKDLKTAIKPLEQKDFKLFENGREEKITFFGSTETPFDLVLLIDLSGSTSAKRDLIHKSTRRFIEAARPSDRIAIVTFTDLVNVASPLTSDRSALLQSVKKIDGTGGSWVWDALKYTLCEVIGAKTPERRKAIVLMTDGADNTLLDFVPRGSKTSFADLLEIVRQQDALIIPVYLDTEFDGIGFGANNYQSMKVYKNARNTLVLLAEQSGGLFYKARKIEDLNGVYEQVLNDLGKVYSLGYTPTNEKRDGAWRNVSIQIPGHPDLIIRSRAGYYAK